MINHFNFCIAGAIITTKKKQMNIPSYDKIFSYLVSFFSAYKQYHYNTLSEDQRLVYYTNAETAKKIIQNKEIWLRNSLLMNDHSEITYGLSVVKKVMNGPVGARIYSLAEEIYPETGPEVKKLLEQSEEFWKSETYLTCLSLHDSSEDQIGRLSMWRAYGDVAFVINNTPFLNETLTSIVYSTPVHYGEKEHESQLNSLAEQIKARTTELKSLNEEESRTILVKAIYMSYFLPAMATKHPGFSEEREWRIFYHPTGNESPLLERRIENIAGVVQPIYALKLENDPGQGMDNADIPSLLDRIIIGPTSQPYVIKSAFVELLTGAGVTNASDKVYVSDIPLRSSSQ